MAGLTSIGRIVYAIPFIVFGLMHFMKGGQMAGFVPSFIPGGIFWVYITGLALVAAGVSFIANKYVKMAGIGLAAMLAIFVLTIHLPGVMGGNQNQMASLLKDTSLLGAALVFAGIFDDSSPAA